MWLSTIPGVRTHWSRPGFARWPRASAHLLSSSSAAHGVVPGARWVGFRRRRGCAHLPGRARRAQRSRLGPSPVSATSRTFVATGRSGSPILRSSARNECRSATLSAVSHGICLSSACSSARSVWISMSLPAPPCAAAAACGRSGVDAEYPDAGQMGLHERLGGKQLRQVGVHGVGHPPPAGELPMPGPRHRGAFRVSHHSPFHQAARGQVTYGVATPRGLGCDDDSAVSWRCRCARARSPSRPAV